MSTDIGSAPPAVTADAIREWIDKAEIVEVIRLERLWRDLGKWDQLADAYAEDSQVRTTWFSGTGRAFAEASKEMAERRARHSKHLITPTEVRVNGDRAVVESLGEIHNRDRLDGVEVDTTQYCRFVSRLVRTAAGWKIVSFEGIYQRDMIAPVFPGEAVPLDKAEVESFRPAYRIWAYMLSRKGYAIPQGAEIVSEDRPDLVEAFYKEADEWLAGGSGSREDMA